MKQSISDNHTEWFLGLSSIQKENLKKCLRIISECDWNGMYAELVFKNKDSNLHLGVEQNKCDNCGIDIGFRKGKRWCSDACRKQYKNKLKTTETVIHKIESKSNNVKPINHQKIEKMKTEIKKITPEIAKEILKRNPNNRNVSARNVAFLTAEMNSGRWLFDGSPIRLSKSGALLDGQHRLFAIINSNTTQEMLVISGIDTEAFKVMDTGKTRTADDTLHINGISNSRLAAGTISICMKIESGKLVNDKISNSEVLEYFNQNEDLKPYIAGASKLYAGFNGVIPKATIAAFWYLMSRKNVTDADIFWNKVCFGLDLDAGSPMLVLRNKLIKETECVKTSKRRQICVYN